jgi:hypothetical protein
MTTTHLVRSLSRGVAYGAGLAAGAYAAYVGAAWLRYGRVNGDAPDTHDLLLDRFMPVYDVVDRHRIDVAAPADVTLAAACDVDLQRSATIRAIFKGRELVLGSDPDTTERPRGLVPLTKALGWGVLDEIPGREIVLGAVTRPWDANVVFRAVPPDEFAAFAEPDYVKIVWNLRADPKGDRHSIARTETRVVTTDHAAHVKFRRYWSVFSAGIVLIRRCAMRLTKAEAERRARSR